MVIGGVNLLKNSDFSKGTESWGASRGTIEVIKDRITVLKYTSNPAQRGAHYPIQGGIKTGHVETIFTASMWVWSEEAISIRLAIGHLDGQPYKETSETYKIEANKWAYLTVTAKFNSVYGSANVMAHVEDSNEVQKNFYVYHPKLEYGTVATDWSPSPYDYSSLEARIAALETKIQ